MTASLLTLQRPMVLLITTLIFVLSSSVQADDVDQKENMNGESKELSDSNKDLTVEKQAKELNTHKVEQKLHDREVIMKSAESAEMPKDQDRAGKTISEKRDVHSDGPRADGNENTPLETQDPVLDK